jgi:uncharacterized protein YifN (PemK superfamily)
MICDFERGFVPPEMVKVRPVVVISRTSTHENGLCTIVPLSTTPPQRAKSWHVQLKRDPTPCLNSGQQVWAKCDMLYTVSHKRLDRPHTKLGGRRDYLTVRVTGEDLNTILDGVRRYLP